MCAFVCKCLSHSWHISTKQPNDRNSKLIDLWAAIPNWLMFLWLIYEWLRRSHTHAARRLQYVCMEKCVSLCVCVCGRYVVCCACATIRMPLYRICRGRTTEADRRELMGVCLWVSVYIYTCVNMYVKYLCAYVYVYPLLIDSCARRKVALITWSKWSKTKEQKQKCRKKNIRK